MVGNPYWTAGAIRDPKRFIGRRELMEKVFDALHKGMSVELVGGRQIGKSSVLAMVQRPEVQTQHGFSPPPELLPLNCQAIGGGLDEPAFWRCLAECLGVPRGDGDPYQSLCAALQPRKGQVAFLLDEFDALDVRTVTAALFNRLRALAEGTCQFVFAVRRRLSEWVPTDGRTSPLFNLTQLCRLGVLTPDEARDLILTPAEGQRGLDEGLVRPVLDATGTHPYLVQALCSALYESRGNAVDETTVRRVAEEISPNVLDWRGNLSPAEAELLGSVLASGPDAATMEANETVASALVGSGWLTKPGYGVPALLRTILSPKPAMRATGPPGAAVPRVALAEAEPPDIGPCLEALQQFKSQTKVRCGTLAERVRWSRDLISRISKKCCPSFGSEADAAQFTIGVCGSVARLEAGPGSDLDAFIVFDDRNYSYPKFKDVQDRAGAIFQRLGQLVGQECGESVSVHEFKQKKEDRGTFPVAFRLSSLQGKVGTQDDTPEIVTRRICLLTESHPIHHPRLFEEIRSAVLGEYSVRESVLVNSVPEMFVREFRSWCSSFWIRAMARAVRKADLRDLNWIKLWHQRTFSHAAMLWWFADLQHEDMTEEGVVKGITSPPLWKAAQLAAKHLDVPALTGLLEPFLTCYNDSLKALSDEFVRLRLGAEGVPADAPPLMGIGQVRQTLYDNGAQLRGLAEEILSQIAGLLPASRRRRLMGTLLL